MKKHRTVNLVEAILREVPESRDNDNLLILKFWWNDLKHIVGASSGAKLTHIGAVQFCKGVIGHNLAPAESITRARRLVQAEQPGLRGEKYSTRQEKAERFKYQGAREELS